MKRRRRHPNWAFRGTILGILLAIIAYVLIASAFQAGLTPFGFTDLWISRAVDCLVVAWLFWVGSAVGSFLNVVAWRMPRGRSINGLSHCPWCNQRLAAQDNWPVFGWIALRGRCRTCRLPISPRYPIVELAVGLCLTAVGLVEIYSGLWNLPAYTPAARNLGPLAAPIITFDIVRPWVYHSYAIAGLWAFSLIAFDHARIPKKLLGFILIPLAMAMLVWTDLGIVPWQASVPENWPEVTRLDILVRLLSAIAAAVLIARALARYLCARADLKLDPLNRDTGRLVDLIAMLVVVAIVVGWQALFGVVVLAAIVAVVALRRAALSPAIARDGYAWFAVALPIATTVQIVCWRWLENSLVWPSSQSSPWVVLGYAALVLIVPAWLRLPKDEAVDNQEAFSEEVDDDEDDDDDETKEA